MRPLHLGAIVRFQRVPTENEKRQFLDVVKVRHLN